MYNLTVDTAHTFFVGKGQWLVHNACPILPSRSGGKTSGILITETAEIHLTSGWDGPASQMPKGAPGFDIVTRTHVEGHAAALMHQNGWNTATLYLNNVPCASCSKLLSKMLPPGSSLEVIVPNVYRHIFYGLPK